MTHPIIPAPASKLLLACLLAASSAWSPATASDAEAKPATSTAPIHQLRVYRILDDTREAFHDRFRDHAMRIMERHGFDIVAIWESRSDEGPEFVYLLKWPDEAAMKAAWASFMADEEWAAIKRETAKVHGRFVDGIEEKTLLVTDYSPSASLAK